MSYFKILSEKVILPNTCKYNKQNKFRWDIVSSTNCIGCFFQDYFCENGLPVGKC